MRARMAAIKVVRRRARRAVFAGPVEAGVAAADALLKTPSHPSPVPMHVCTHYRGGTGEVLQFRNLGCNAKHEVTARREKLPANLRELPNGTDIMVTFATGSVATMACNWVATVRKAGVDMLANSDAEKP